MKLRLSISNKFPAAAGAAGLHGPHGIKGQSRPQKTPTIHSDTIPVFPYSLAWLQTSGHTSAQERQMCPDWESKWQPSGAQDDTQPTGGGPSEIFLY